ncbi:unnamed protein product [Phaeothamnion confervicola]
MRKGQGKLREVLEDAGGGLSSKRWTRISGGISLPANDGDLKAWELDLSGGPGGKKEPVKIAAIRHAGSYHAMDAMCSKCGWELWRGEVVTTGGDSAADVESAAAAAASVACPLCGTTYGLMDGRVGAPVKRAGLAGWVGGLARQATVQEAATPARIYPLRVLPPDYDGAAAGGGGSDGETAASSPQIFIDLA